MLGKFNEGNLTIEPNATLSPLDKGIYLSDFATHQPHCIYTLAFMAINYPKSRMHYQLRHALFVANIDENTSRAIMEEYDITKRRALFTDYISATRRRRSAIFVDPTPQTIIDTTPQTIIDFALPAVQDELHIFFDNIDSYPGAEEIRADNELMEELNIVLTSFAHYDVVEEVVQETLRPGIPTSPEILRVDEGFTDRLMDVVAMLHAALAPQSPAGSQSSIEARQVDAVTALFKELGQHAVFQDAMKRAIGQDTLYPGAELVSPSHGPGSAIIAQLFKRPAVLRAVRQALIGYPRSADW